MQDTLAVLQKQIVQMHQLITATQAEMKGVREQFAVSETLTPYMLLTTYIYIYVIVSHFRMILFDLI